MRLATGATQSLAILAMTFLGACGTSESGSSLADATLDGAADHAATDMAGDLTDDLVQPIDGIEESSGDQGQGDTSAGDTEDDETDVEAPPQDWHLQAIAACEPGPVTCEGPLTGQAAGTYRSDFYYPFEVYPELGNETVQGGRVQIAALAKAGGAVTKVELNGTDVTHLAFPEVLDDVETPGDVLALTVPGTYHWVHVWPFVLQPERPFFLAFHVGTLALEGASDATQSVMVHRRQGTWRVDLFMIGWDDTVGMGQTLFPSGGER